MSASELAPAHDNFNLQAGELSTPRKLRWVVIAGLVSANILVGLLAAVSLSDSRRLNEKAAESLTQNIAAALDLNVSKDVQKVDLALLSVVDELEQQLSKGTVNEARAGSFLTKLEHRLPEVEAIRVARADGLVILGKEVDMRSRISWVDRPYFTNLRDRADVGPEVFGPVEGRVSKQIVIIFSRRFNHPDGSFAGVVSAPIPVKHFMALLSQFNVGPSGTLILRDASLGLISRVPPLPDNPAGQIGNQVVSKDFRQVFEAGARVSTSVTSASPDGFRRIFTFRRLSAAPFVAIVATAQQDYLAEWVGEMYRTVAMVGGIFLLSVVMGANLLRLMRLNEMNVRRANEGKRFVSNILDSLNEHIVVIDSQGRIAAVNASWRRFAADNGAPDDAQVSIGANYLEVCSCVVDAQHTGDAQRAYTGVKAVLEGTQKDFLMEYACHSPTEQRWFVLHVVPLLGANQGAVVIHQNVTLIHQARAGLIESEQRFRAMAEMSADWYWEQDSQFRFTRIDRGPKHDTLPNVGNWIGKTRWDAQTPGLGVADWDAHRAALAAHAEFRDFEYRVKSSDGTISWISIRGAPRFDGGGVFCGYHGVGTNISQRKEQEEKRALLAERLAELSRRLVQAQEQARHHLARELHELTSPNLAALRINLAILAKATPIQREDQDFVDRVADTRALIDDTTSNIRDICAELHSTALEGGGMVGVVENYAQQFAKRTSIKVTVHCAHAEVHLAPALALPLFRIVQEALTNCAKHAQARTVDITLQFASLPMLLQVRDDGVGFDPSPAQRTQAGLGLINMRETAEFVGGTLTLSSQAGIGTTVRVDIALPLPESAA